MLSPITPHLSQHLWWELDQNSLVVDVKWPEAKEEMLEEDFIKIGIQEKWIDYIMELYSNPENLLSHKPTQIHQKLNGYRKKNKLTIDALQLEEVKKWFQ